MICYALKCAEGHRFDSWFQSAEAYEKLLKSGMVACAVCGSSEVEKAIMAPRVGAGRQVAEAPERTAEPEGALQAPGSEVEQAVAELRRQVEANSDYVGSDFASEARAMHEGEAPTRAIYGEARVDEARALLKDGVPVAPLPFIPQRKTN